jgi:hypothetical protein
MTQSYSHRPKADWPAPGRGPLKRPRWPAFVGIVAGVMVLLFPVGAIYLLSQFNGPNHPQPRPTATSTDTHLRLAAVYTACGSKGLLGPHTLYMDTSTGTVSRADIGCVLDKLDAPLWVSAEIDQTPARQFGEDKWGPFSIDWHWYDRGDLELSIFDNRY